MEFCKTTVACLVIALCFSSNLAVLGNVLSLRTAFFVPAHAQDGPDGGAGGGEGGGGGGGEGGGASGEGGGGVGGDTGVGNDGAMGGPAGEGPGDQGVGLGGSPDDSNTDTSPSPDQNTETTQTQETTQETTTETAEETQEQQTEVAPTTPAPETKSFGLLDALANFFGAVVSFAIGTPIGAVVGMVATNVSQLAMGIQTNVERAADLVSSVFSESPGVSPGQPTSPTDASSAGGEFAGFLNTDESNTEEGGLSGVNTGTPNAFFGTLASLFEDVSVPAVPSLSQIGTAGTPPAPAQPSSGAGDSSSAGVRASPPSITFNLDTNFSTLTRTLYWTAKEATVCVGTNFSTSGRLSGSVPIANSVDATVSIICGGAGGIAEKSIQVRPLDASAASASPITVETINGNFSVTWDAPSDVCVITNTDGFSYRIPSKTGSVDAGPAKSDVQFSITCEN